MEGVNLMYIKIWFKIPKRISDVVNYLVNIHPDTTTWDNITLALYCADEREALKRAVSYVRLVLGECVVRVN